MNKLLPMAASITDIKKESENTRLIRLKLISSHNRAKFSFSAGQFIQVSIPGFGEAPFSIASNPKNRERFEIFVKKVGTFTKKLFSLNRADRVGIRGPLGNGFNLETIKNRDLVLISGGCGIAPMRSLLLTIGNNPQNYGQIKFYFGSKSKDHLYFRNEYQDWQKFAEINIITEIGSSNFSKENGFVTDLIKEAKISSASRALVCGPGPMIETTIKELYKKTIPNKNIFLSLERRMSCGVGVCQHCNIGSKYVCKDGPVFSLKEIIKEDKTLFNA
jgi:NAD(P)H-flavin reductase